MQQRKCTSGFGTGLMIDTTFLRFVAILLITNSHLDKLYPIAAMSTGGQLGNSLFFMLSGFGLAASFRKKGDVFWNWLPKRLARIYPSVLLVTLTAAVITGAMVEWSMADYVRHLLWPTEYWFVAAIVCFYVPFYGLMRLNRKAVFLQMIVLLFVPYFYFYLTALDLSYFSIEDGFFKWIYYFQIMLLGGFLANHDIAAKPIISPRWNTVLLGLFLVAYAGMKLLVANSVLTGLQFLIHWVTFPVVVFSLFAMDTPLVKEIIMKSVAAPFVALVAGATLEIYLFQQYVYGNPFISALAFPGNMAVFWPAVIVGGISIARVSATGRRYFSGWAGTPSAIAYERNKE